MRLDFLPNLDGVFIVDRTLTGPLPGVRFQPTPRNIGDSPTNVALGCMMQRGSGWCMDGGAECQQYACSQGDALHGVWSCACGETAAGPDGLSCGCPAVFLETDPNKADFANLWGAHHASCSLLLASA